MGIPIKKYIPENPTNTEKVLMVEIGLTTEELINMQNEINRLALSENTDVLETFFAKIKHKKAFEKSKLTQLKNALVNVNMQYKTLYELKIFIA